MDELEKRLRGRGTESEEKIKIRLTNAGDEMAYGNTEGNFDAVVVNDDVNRAVGDIVTLLRRWYGSVVPGGASETNCFCM